eukprot:CAMPEP_0116901642 /NCGR_PEP_ID=MMETSP0467-20121206/9493_1 /TAXON_ID=283647 /ORGANISM="Mesodinium pulex, Strain SPMC105" /LENGTH=126 /DNA_ID=CAMNT_0004575231 /DNA_START=1472 /DNA_END=1852 /DNA_ORIENTATION=+
MRLGIENGRLAPDDALVFEHPDVVDYAALHALGDEQHVAVLVTLDMDDAFVGGSHHQIRRVGCGRTHDAFTERGIFVILEVLGTHQVRERQVFLFNVQVVLKEFYFVEEQSSEYRTIENTPFEFNK